MSIGNQTVAQLSAILLHLRHVFTSHVRAMARACAVDGALNARQLDRNQVPSYELAFASAELFAAETVLGELSADSSDLAIRLATTYAADACKTVSDRLLQVALDLEGDAGSLLPFALSAQLAEIYRTVSSGRALDDTGRMLSASGEEIGQVHLGEELAMAQSQFRRFAAEVIAPAAMKIHRDNSIVPDEVLEALREMGVFGLAIPEQFGGSAPDDREDTVMMIVVTEALSEASLAAAGSLITRPEILARALLAGGTLRQKQRWLPMIARGAPLCAIAITEPDYGSDVAALQLRGTKVEGGWRLNGAKTWCTFAGKAELIMVVARTNPERSLGHRGLSVLLVEKPSYDGHAFDYEQSCGGRLVGRAIPTIGYRGMHSFDLSFEDVFVPDANVIGEHAGLGKGFYFTMAGMTGGRLQTAARALGVMRAALLAALRYAADRKVFKAPLAEYSLTRAKLARMAARFIACRQMTYAVARRLDAGGGRMEASLIKLFACRTAEWLTREALQLHGGMGYAEETPVSRYFVDARVLSIFEGAEETLAVKVVARNLFDDVLRADSALETA